MNKLEAISRRSKRARTVVRLVKTAITGVCACALIISSTQLGIGYVTYALEDDSHNRRTDAYSSPNPTKPAMLSLGSATLNEDEIVSMFAPTAGDDVGYERPSLQKPAGYEGAYVKREEGGAIFLYGDRLTQKTGKAKADKLTAAGTPAKSETADASYFDNAVMIGNSLVVGMQKTGVFTNARFYANVGLCVSQFFDKACFISPDGATNADGSSLRVSAAEALMRDDSFEKVYLMFGINELGWSGTSTFIAFYSAVIDTILTIRPDAVIYVQAIMPINEEMYAETSGAYDVYTNARVDMFNAEIKKMAQSKNVIFLTPGEVAVGEDGQLRADATLDGIHLNGNFIKRWRTYLETHTVPSVDLAEFYGEGK